MKTNYLIIFFFFVACTKENSDLELYKKSQCECAKNINLDCTEDPLFNDYYFKGTINNKSFCIQSSRYTNSNGFGVKFGPVSPFEPFNPANSNIQNSFYQISLTPPVKDNNNGLYEELAPIINIQTPYVYDSIGRDPQFYLDKFFNLGEYKLESKSNKRASSYLFNISWGCVLKPGYEYYKHIDPFRIPAVGVTLSTLPGVQKNSKFIIQKSELSEENGGLFLELEIEIECDLYFDDSYLSYQYYGRLANGIYKTRVRYQ
ncbi:MAG: hypothetical protein ABIO44_08865 [Saprospiraceae bacterium]